MSDTEDTPGSPSRQTPGVVAGFDLDELDRLNTILAQGMARSYGLGDMAGITLVGGLLSIARGPYGGASTMAYSALLQAATEVQRAAR